MVVRRRRSAPSVFGAEPRAAWACVLALGCGGSAQPVESPRQPAVESRVERAPAEETSVGPVVVEPNVPEPTDQALRRDCAARCDDRCGSADEGRSRTMCVETCLAAVACGEHAADDVARCARCVRAHACSAREGADPCFADCHPERVEVVAAEEVSCCRRETARRAKRVGAYVVEARSTVYRWSDGVLESFTPAQGVTISDVPVRARTFVSLRRDGALSEGTLDRDTVIEGMTIPAGSEVLFDDAGRLFRIVPGGAMHVGGCEVAAGVDPVRPLVIQCTGVPRWLPLAAACEIGGRRFESGDLVALTPFGHLL